MDQLLRTQAQLRQKCEAARLDLVSAELDLAITFCKVAATTTDQGRAARNIANAEEAYASAFYYLNGNAITSEVEEKLRYLQSLLSNLGRGLPSAKRPVSFNSYAQT